MPQNNGSTATDAATKSGTPEAQIKDLEAQLIELIAQKQKAERNLVDLEFRLYQLEGNYLEETAAGGNIVRGFDGYTGSGARSANPPGGGALGGSGSQKRARAPVADTDRIFSMSSSTLHKSLEAKKAEFEARDAEMTAAAAAAAVVMAHGGVHATPAATKGGAATASTRKRAAATAAGMPASPSVVTPTANKKRSGAAAGERAPKRARTGTAGIDEGNE
ncbi:hypothetical protein AMAG_10040 [Allomyces macrogynus ATCC 38327]|uniref:Chromatin modification-related protein EAF6 n=1 Tax=Allomyces macrogynus (strain ATCC 38327) TaxID=578462 RepID=A0A0L0SQ60_ALLM3|nr:hypothetical protein AMAG_10040 [Allomyces macrogynus ATCC 38327]|eukprot:KNE64688.1 hypothetical protein AMAG_10040 [Allomyces macrogynus ATCC 38327]